jgi:hypothetical protein
MKKSILLILTANLFLFGCGKDIKKVEEKSSIETKNIYKQEKVAVKEKKEDKNVEKSGAILSDDIVNDPILMYLKNKHIMAENSVKASFLENNGDKEEDYFVKNKVESMRNYYVKGDYEKAFIKGRQILSSANVPPQLKAEIYFMMADISKKNRLSSEALKFVGKAYEAMKEIPKSKSIRNQVKSFGDLLKNIDDINKNNEDYINIGKGEEEK